MEKLRDEKTKKIIGLNRKQSLSSSSVKSGNKDISNDKDDWIS
jgi:hypothetical protein